MGEILAIDPGLTKPGVALMRDGLIVQADRLKVPKDWAKLQILERCYLVARLAVDWGLALGMGRHYKRLDDGREIGLELIVEFPQWYGGDTKIDPNDLAGLACISGAALGILNTLPHCPMTRARSPVPREVWGNVPKSTTGNPWTSPRGQKLARRLHASERAKVAKYHDALDAAALALYAAGRWKQQRLYPGAV